MIKLNDVYEVKYVLENAYNGKGARVLSEYLQMNIGENYLIYNDSIRTLITANTNSGSGFAFISEANDYSIVFDISDLSKIQDLLTNDLHRLVSVNECLENEVVSRQLFLRIISNDTFAIDYNLGKLFKNGECIGPKLYVWDIPGLLRIPIPTNDSSSSIYRIEIDNVVQIDSVYVLFCTGNQFVISPRRIDHVEVVPRTLALVFESDRLNSLTNFQTTLLDEYKDCYYDSYAILQSGNKTFVITECGKGRLNPKMVELNWTGSEIVPGKKYAIKIPAVYKSSPGYTTDLGQNLLFFIGTHQVMEVDFQDGSVRKGLDFTSWKRGEIYIVGTSGWNGNDQFSLFSTKNTYELVCSSSSVLGNANESVIYKIIVNKEKYGDLHSNCFYKPDNCSFTFINQLGKIISIRALASRSNNQ